MELFNTENNPYPNKIYFDTYINRYRKAYWVELHSMAIEKIYTSVHAAIQNGDIHITSKNITGLTVNIPPQVDSDSGMIYMNECEISIDGRKYIDFVCTENDCIISDTKPTLPTMYKEPNLLMYTSVLSE